MLGLLSLVSFRNTRNPARHPDPLRSSRLKHLSLLTPPHARMTSPRLSTGQRLGDMALWLAFTAFFAVVISHG